MFNVLPHSLRRLFDTAAKVCRMRKMGYRCRGSDSTENKPNSGALTENEPMPDC